MAYDKASARALSNNWRVYCLGLDEQSRLQLIASMTAATSVNSERNVRLWFATNDSYRNILNRTLNPEEYELRERIIKGCLRLNNENVPLKTANSNSTRSENAKKFEKYAKDGYTGKFNRSIEFSPNGFQVQYDAYGIDTSFDDDDDEDYIEFAPKSTLSDDFIEEFL